MSVFVVYKSCFCSSMCVCVCSHIEPSISTFVFFRYHLFESVVCLLFLFIFAFCCYFCRYFSFSLFLTAERGPIFVNFKPKNIRKKTLIKQNNKKSRKSLNGCLYMSVQVCKCMSVSFCCEGGKLDRE